ncbi:MAG: hypothetical protein QOE26_879 [Verrucomicrobiota bacterium]
MILSAKSWPSKSRNWKDDGGNAQFIYPFFFPSYSLL